VGVVMMMHRYFHHDKHFRQERLLTTGECFVLCLFIMIGVYGFIFVHFFS
jgi:hypothetical protein